MDTLTDPVPGSTLEMSFSAHVTYSISVPPFVEDEVIFFHLLLHHYGMEIVSHLEKKQETTERRRRRKRSELMKSIFSTELSGWYKHVLLLLSPPSSSCVFSQLGNGYEGTNCIWKHAQTHNSICPFYVHMEYSPNTSRFLPCMR